MSAQMLIAQDFARCIMITSKPHAWDDCNGTKIKFLIGTSSFVVISKCVLPKLKHRFC